MQGKERYAKLFGGQDRDEAHRQLEKVIKGKKHPAACCREDPNDTDEPFQVWSGPPSPYTIE